MPDNNSSTGGPVDTPELDLGPGHVPEGIGADNALHVPEGVDPLEFDPPTGDGGQPADESDIDAGGQDAPGADTPADPQTPEPDSGTSPKPWEGQHPDKLDLASMTEEQFVQWATENPDAARRYALRQDDYTKKTEEVARREEALEQRERELEELRRDIREQPSGEQQGTQQGPQEGQDGALAWMQGNGMNLYTELQEQLGREPNYVEFASYAASRAAQDAAQQSVEPLRTRVDETTQQFEQRQRQALAESLKSEFETLVDERPQASDPERQKAISTYLERHPSLLTEPNPIRTAYNALYAETDMQATNTGKHRARQEQAAASQQTPSTPPSGHQGSGPDIPTGFDDFYDWASRQAGQGTLLDRIPAP